MQFKDIQQGCAVYILNKQDMTVTEGKVNSKSFPYMKTINGITQMVLDVGIEAAGKTATYAIPENLMTTYAGDLVVTTERKNLIPEVKRVMNEAEKLLASNEKLKSLNEKYIKLTQDKPQNIKSHKSAIQFLPYLSALVMVTFIILSAVCVILFILLNLQILILYI